MALGTYDPRRGCSGAFRCKWEKYDVNSLGAFTLAYHGWTEPIERALQKANEANVKLMAPKIGETVPLTGEFTVPFSAWWRS